MAGQHPKLAGGGVDKRRQQQDPEGVVAQAAPIRPRSNSCVARVAPQPGQSHPVNWWNVHSGRCISAGSNHQSRPASPAASTATSATFRRAGAAGGQRFHHPVISLAAALDGRSEMAHARTLSFGRPILHSRRRAQPRPRCRTPSPRRSTGPYTESAPRSPSPSRANSFPVASSSRRQSAEKC